MIIQSKVIQIPPVLRPNTTNINRLLTRGRCFSTHSSHIKEFSHSRRHSREHIEDSEYRTTEGGNSELCPRHDHMHKSNPRLRKTSEKKSVKQRSPATEKKKLKSNGNITTSRSIQLTQQIEVHTPSTVNEEKFE